MLLVFLLHISHLESNGIPQICFLSCWEVGLSGGVGGLESGVQVQAQEEIQDNDTHLERQD